MVENPVSFPFLGVEIVEFSMLKNEEFKFLRILHYFNKGDFFMVKN